MAAKFDLKTFKKARETEVPEDELISGILVIAKSLGFWSIWMTVFEGYPSVRRALIEAFQGSSLDSFDDNTQPKQRGRVTLA